MDDQNDHVLPDSSVALLYGLVVVVVPERFGVVVRTYSVRALCMPKNYKGMTNGKIE
jgi:hypothetical protein